MISSKNLHVQGKWLHKVDWDKFSTSLNTYLLDSSDNESFRVCRDISANKLTTSAVGGHVACVIETHTLGTLFKILTFVLSQKVHTKFLGNGSNVIIPDLGISDALVVKMTNKLSYEKFFENEEYAKFSVLSGCSLMGLSRELSNLGYSGLEFAAGIPATIGGAVKMNAGAHGESMSNILTEVDVFCYETFNQDSRVLTYTNKDLNFSYRHSSIQENEYVTSVRMRLQKGDPEKIKEKRSSALAHRKNTQPLHMPSSGSVFKNPSDEFSAGYLIESAGLKGLTHGGVMVSDMHANWIVKINENAKAIDIKNLVDIIKNTVYKFHKIELQQEIIFW